MKPSNLGTTLFVLLMLVAGSASADWMRVHEDDRSIQYIDPATAKSEGKNRKVWELYNFKEPQHKGLLSVRFRSEYDCLEARSRKLLTTGFSAQMATGEVLISTNKESAWTDIPPNTPAAKLLAALCD